MNDDRSTTAMGQPRHTILVIDDEPDLLRGVELNLRRHGYGVLTAATGEQGLQLALEHEPDLIVLDVMLPGANGFEVCTTLRQRGVETPVILLTAKTRIADRVAGLEIGADDYITKPFSLQELVARIRARLRRRARPAAAPVRIGEITIDFGRCVAWKGGVRLSLTSTELDILELLVRRAGRVVPRQELLEELGYRGDSATRTVGTHMANLRKKIEHDPADPQIIRTVYGKGYRIVL